MGRNSDISIVPIVFNGVEQDILIAVSIKLGIQCLSDDIGDQFCETFIRS